MLSIMAEEKGNGWNQYSKLVLKEIDALGQAVTALREEITGLREVLSEMKSNSAYTLSAVNDLKHGKRELTILYHLHNYLNWLMRLII